MLFRSVAAVLNGHCRKGEDVRVKLTGGDLLINYTDERVMMTGTAEKVFEGEIDIVGLVLRELL